MIPQVAMYTTIKEFDLTTVGDNFYGGGVKDDKVFLMHITQAEFITSGSHVDSKISSC